MPRSLLTDYMQNHRFWLMDTVPSSTYPFFVLGGPLGGFQSITAPEYTAEVEEIKQLNSMFKRSSYVGGGLSPITLTRGVRGHDDDFWNWMHSAISGNDMTNRNLLLLHFTGVATSDDPLGIEAWDGVPFVPGKAWLLYDCIPTRYKAGSDFEGGGGQVSIAELDITPWAIFEMSFLK